MKFSLLPTPRLDACFFHTVSLLMEPKLRPGHIFWSPLHGLYVLP